MGLPEDYDWGLTPEAMRDVRQEMTVSVGFTLNEPHQALPEPHRGLK